MTAPDISAAAIEAGAEALWNWTMNDDVAVDPEPWRLVDSEDRQRCTEAVLGIRADSDDWAWVVPGDESVIIRFRAKERTA